jgi:predicted adenylyl cyclase CyaB
MREIEVLVQVLESKNSALKKLSKYGEPKIANIIDKYYYDERIKGMYKRDMTEMLRVRTKNDKSYITYKKDIFLEKKWQYSDEYETEVKDPMIIEQIFKFLMLKPLVTVNNTRSIYYYNNYEICLEDVKDLGLFLEIECLKPGRKTPDAVRKEIFELIEEIGIKVSIGKAEMMYKKKRK